MLLDCPDWLDELPDVPAPLCDVPTSEVPGEPAPGEPEDPAPVCAKLGVCKALPNITSDVTITAYFFITAFLLFVSYSATLKATKSWRL